jgi:hypothetical protein
MGEVPMTEPVREQDFDWLAQQFFAGITECALGLRIYIRNAPDLIGHDDGVGREFKKILEQDLRLERGEVVV